MREIKFRGREVVGNARKLSGWVYGDLVHYCGGYERTVDDEITPVVTEICIECADCLHTVDPATVGQFTGLLDSAGRDIYEGDVIDLDGEFIAEVVYSNGNYELYTKKEPLGTLSDIAYEYSRSIYDGLEKTFSVIGNIHDSPELLEDSNGRL